MDFKFKIDWLSFTFRRPDRQPAEQIEEFLLAFPFLKDYFDHNLSYAGGNHYERNFRFTDGVILSYDLHNSKGVNLSISGSCLAGLFDWIPDISNADDPLKGVLRYLENHYSRVSRIDLAFDDYSKTYTPLDILYLHMGSRVCSPYKDDNFFFAGAEESGYTIQFGKRSSGSHLRIYDKDKESKGAIPAIRYEFELHGLTARKFCNGYLNCDKFNFKEFFLSKFKILVENAKDYSKKYNAPIDPVFDAFVNMSFANISSDEVIPRYVENKTPDRVFNSFIRSLKTVVRDITALPPEFVKEIIYDIMDRFSDYDIRIQAQNKAFLGQYVSEHYLDII